MPLAALLLEGSSVYQIIALLIFFSLFLLVGIYVSTDRRRQHHKRMCAMPLDDDEEPRHD